MKTKNKNSSLVTIDNLLGLILAILIIFQIRPKPEDSNLLNSPLGIVMSLVLVVILFITLHPVVGLLALIYLYEIIRHSPSYLKPTKEQNIEKLNSPKELQLEEILIRESDYSRIKNQNMNRDTDVNPVLSKTCSMVL
jgi:predicted membrane protein